MALLSIGRSCAQARRSGPNTPSILGEQPLAATVRSETGVESSVLMLRATWCGVVFALATVLTALNFVPPFHIEYHVHSKVVVSETRLAQLRELAIADRQAVQKGEKKRIQLLSVKVLDLAEQTDSLGPESTAEQVILIEVGTLWRHRCTPQRHFTWLSNISKVGPARIASLPAAQTSRFARWNLQAAEHYQTQYKYLSSKQPLLEDLPPVNVASNQSPPGFQLAGFSQPTTTPANRTSEMAVQPASAAGSEQSSAVGVSNPISNQEFELQLSDQIKTAQEVIKQADVEVLAELERSSGTLQIAGVPVIAARSTSIPLWMAASILIVGLATGSTAGWFQYRAQSGGIYQPQQVAEQLALDSIPLVASLVLPSTDSRLPGAASAEVVRQGGRHLGGLSEWVLTGWVAIAVARFLFDSVWRDVLVNSPLAALGRMLAGMP